MRRIAVTGRSCYRFTRMLGAIDKVSGGGFIMMRRFLVIALTLAIPAVAAVTPSIADDGAEFASPGADEVLFFESENLKAFGKLNRHGVWCAQGVQVRLYVRDASVFGDGRPELDAFLSGLPDLLRSQCAKVRNAGIKGFLAGKQIYKARFNRLNTEPVFSENILDRTIRNETAKAVTTDTPPRTRGNGTSPGQPAEHTQGRLYTEASTVGEQCAILAEWVARFHQEYPFLNNSISQTGEVQEMATNLLADAHYVPVFGKPYDEASPEQKLQIYTEIFKRCPKEFRSKRWVQVAFNYAFRASTGGDATEIATGKAKAHREIRLWMREQAATLDGASVTSASLDNLQALATTGAKRISVLWPSEQQVFNDRVLAAKSFVALGVANQRISALPAEADSLSALAAIVGETEPHVVASDDDQFAALIGVADQRRQAIRDALVEAEIAALAAYPDNLESLDEMAKRRDWLLQTVGRTPTLPALDRYEQARAARADDLAGVVLVAYQAELNRIPASFAGANEALGRYAAIAPLLEASVPARRGAFQQAAQVRADTIYDELIAASVVAIQPAGDRWRDAIKIFTLLKDETAKFQGTRAYERAVQTITAAAATAANGVVKIDFDRFKKDLSSLPDSWSGIEELDEMTSAFYPLLGRVSAFQDYEPVAVARRGEILDAVAQVAREQIQETGITYLDVETIRQVGEEHADKFDQVQAAKHAASLRQFSATRAVAFVEAYFPTFEDEIAARDATRENAADLTSLAGDFKAQTEQIPAFEQYQQAALTRSDEMFETICDTAVARAALTDIGEDDGILGIDMGMTLREFICRLDDNGHQVSELASPGSLGVEDGFTLKVYQSDGEFMHARLRLIEALPGTTLLVGYALGDANQQDDISVEEWRGRVAMLVGQRRSIAVAGAGPQEIAARLQRSVAFVLWQEPGWIHSGTGFFVTPSLLVTNRHVIEDADPNKIFVTSAALGKLYPGRIVAISGGHYENYNSRDYALVSFEEPLPIDPLIVSTVVNNLAQVITAGYPKFITRGDTKLDRLYKENDKTAAPDMVFTAGEVSVVQVRSNGIPVIIHTALFSHGNSGGPLVDLCGRVIGVNTWLEEDKKYTNRVSFYSIAGSDLVEFLREKGVDGFVSSDESCSD